MTSIRQATRADVVTAAEILGQAFANDPTWKISYPEEEGRAQKIAASYRPAIYAHPSWVDVALDNGKIVGALICIPPTQSTFTRVSTKLLGAGSSIKAMFSDNAKEADKHERKVDAYRPQEPHWYLKSIGTSPAARGKGIGSTLLNYRLGLIDDEFPAPVFLEATSEASKRLYERFGFVTEATVPTGDNQRSTLMLREATHPGD